ncbi:DUF3304 domain-containing protein [Herbaspirillum hiltneri]|uniref:DUF3304 domain-containing protein n=1 Tax=Herbaspirillum hiltneri TaxID=341045 RepID=UPI00130E023C|nr:DUF3304 domain-containing protein [Herbaspirillum hiltneri]
MMIRKALLIFSIAALSACNATAPVVAETKKETKPYVYVPEIAVSIECVAHEGSPYISQFYVGELTRRRMAGGSCGGTIAAGYLLPEKWTPGMTVKVRWKPNGRDFIEKTTNIMRYDEAGTIYVHFFKNDQVRVVAAAFDGPGNPGHPISMALTNPPPEDQ